MNIEVSPQQKKNPTFLVVAFIIVFVLIILFVFGPRFWQKEKFEGSSPMPSTPEEIEAKLKELAAPDGTPLPTQQEIDAKLKELAAPKGTPTPTQEEINAKLKELAAPSQ